MGVHFLDDMTFPMFKTHAYKTIFCTCDLSNHIIMTTDCFALHYTACRLARAETVICMQIANPDSLTNAFSQLGRGHDTHHTMISDNFCFISDRLIVL